MLIFHLQCKLILTSRIYIQRGRPTIFNFAPQECNDQLSNMATRPFYFEVASFLCFKSPHVVFDYVCVCV